jgi:hypothetical protein
MYVTALTIVERFGSDAVVREFRDFDNRRRARLALAIARSCCDEAIRFSPCAGD